MNCGSHPFVFRGVSVCVSACMHAFVCVRTLCVFVRDTHCVCACMCACVCVRVGERASVCECPRTWGDSGEVRPGRYRASMVLRTW